jgi:hypothetical protein
MRLSPKMRARMFYTVEKAGAMEPLGWSRTESYRGVARGDIPTERDGRFLLVPRGLWDAKLRRLRQKMREAGLKRRRTKVEAAHETKVETADA